MAVVVTHTTPSDASFSATGAAAWDAAHAVTGAAASGANSDITSLSGLTTALSVDQGGTGALTLTGVLKGNGTSAISAASAGTDYVAPGAFTTSGLTMATAQLLGRTTAGTGAAQEISVGAGLTLSGGTLVNSGATSPIGGADTQVQFNDGGVFAGNSNITFNKTTNQFSFAAGSASAPSLIPVGDVNTGMWFPLADTIAWSTNGIERLRIASTGQVTTSTTLSVAGAGTLSSTQIAWSAATAFQPQIFLTNTAADATGPIWTTVKSRGGTTPANAGDQLGTFVFVSYTPTATSWNAAQINAVSAGVTATRHAGSLRFVTTDVSDVYAERMRINSDGRVAVGTTVPDALFSVNGISSFGAGAVGTPSIAGFGDLNTGMWFPAADTLAWSTGGVEALRITSAQNIGIGTSTFGTSAAKVLSIFTGTAPTTGPADTIQLYSSDLSAGNTMLSLFTEGTVVNANVVAATTHRIAIRVNGTVYYLLANTSA